MNMTIERREIGRKSEVEEGLVLGMGTILEHFQSEGKYWTEKKD